MERHIGLWKKEYENDNFTAAELIIDGNHIEFYNQDVLDINACAYIGGDGTCRYKVFTNGSDRYGKYKTLDNATSYRVLYVLKQNCAYQKGLNMLCVLCGHCVDNKNRATDSLHKAGFHILHGHHLPPQK